jgi:hypothetical protein
MMFWVECVEEKQKGKTRPGKCSLQWEWNDLCSQSRLFQKHIFHIYIVNWTTPITWIQHASSVTSAKALQTKLHRNQIVVRLANSMNPTVIDFWHHWEFSVLEGNIIPYALWNSEYVKMHTNHLILNWLWQ